MILISDTVDTPTVEIKLTRNGDCLTVTANDISLLTILNTGSICMHSCYGDKLKEMGFLLDDKGFVFVHNGKE